MRAIKKCDRQTNRCGIKNCGQEAPYLLVTPYQPDITNHLLVKTRNRPACERHAEMYASKHHITGWKWAGPETTAPAAGAP